jgi:phosphoglycerate kinase
MVPLIPQKAAGKLVQKEVEYLNKMLEAPERPFAAVLGGAKVSDKLGVVENLLKRVDALMIGGAMAYSFLRAQGVEVGDSLVEEGKIHQAAKILERAKLRDIPFLLPVDHVVVRELKAGAEFHTTAGPAIEKGWKGVDIGPKTLDLFAEQVSRAKMVLWNGPLGAFEIAPFDQGTLALAKVLAEGSAISVVGGGDSVAAVKKAKVESKISHLSTGGGATLEFLEGKTLPGLKALEIED